MTQPQFCARYLTRTLRSFSKDEPEAGHKSHEQKRCQLMIRTGARLWLQDTQAARAPTIQPILTFVQHPQQLICLRSLLRRYRCNINGESHTDLDQSLSFRLRSLEALGAASYACTAVECQDKGQAT
ncbi:hypothetical protein ABBQ38_002602 [Trebouxia sp. C0009 RCD-2024]